MGAAVEEEELDFLAVEFELEEDLAGEELAVLVDIDVAPVELEVSSIPILLLDSPILQERFCEEFDDSTVPGVRGEGVVGQEGREALEEGEDEFGVVVEEELGEGEAEGELASVVGVGLLASLQLEVDAAVAILVVGVLEAVQPIAQNYAELGRQVGRKSQIGDQHLVKRGCPFELQLVLLQHHRHGPQLH